MPRTVDDARRECVTELRRLATICERASITSSSSAIVANAYTERAKAYRTAAEIVQSCFAGLGLEREEVSRE